MLFWLGYFFQSSNKELHGKVRGETRRPTVQVAAPRNHEKYARHSLYLGCEEEFNKSPELFLRSET